MHWCVLGSLGSLRVISNGGIVIYHDRKSLSPMEVQGKKFLGLDIKSKGMVLSGGVTIVTAIKMNPAMGQAANPDEFWRIWRFCWGMSFWK